MTRPVSSKFSISLLLILMAWFVILTPATEAQSNSDSAEEGGNEQYEYVTVRLFSTDPKCDSCSWLQFNGEITKTSAFELKQALSRWRNTKVVQLNSGGGSVWEATQLGLWLRARGVTTVVADTVAIPMQSGTQYAATPASCLSACTYLFAAGTERLALAGSLVGVHQFYTDDFSGWSAADAMSVAQLVQADLSDYLDVMGVSNRLLTIAGRQASQGMDFLNPSELQELNLATETSLAPDYFANLFAGESIEGSRPAGTSDTRSADVIFKRGKSLLLQFAYADAEREFRLFLDRFGDDFRASEATYWLGEVVYQQNNYSAAEEVNATFLRNFPDDARAPEVAVKLARNYRLQGDVVNACLVLNFVQDRYPQRSRVTRNIEMGEIARAGC
jgi:hypothetical protein